jgi:hypothetical protein
MGGITVIGFFQEKNDRLQPAGIFHRRADI